MLLKWGVVSFVRNNAGMMVCVWGDERYLGGQKSDSGFSIGLFDGSVS